MTPALRRAGIAVALLAATIASAVVTADPATAQNTSASAAQLGVAPC